MRSTSGCPLISIVIPNYNSAGTIGRAIESVLNQDYPRIELVVIDGGSTDSSVDVIRRYDSRLAYWISEPDKGQSDAINKGLRRCTGSIVNWLCSDDYLLPGALRAVAEAFASDDCDVVVGRCLQYWLGHDRREKIISCGPETLEQLPVASGIAQPSCFFRWALVVRREPPVREDLHFLMDLELWAHFRKLGARWRFINPVLSAYEMSGSNKTARESWPQVDEYEGIFNAYLGEYAWAAQAYRRLYLPFERRVWSVKDERVRKVLWEIDWKVKWLVARALGCPPLKYLFWSWCAPK